MKKINLLLAPILGLATISPIVATCCNKTTSHIKYEGEKTFVIQAFDKISITCELDKEFDPSVDKIELLCSIDNFFEYTTTIDGKKLTINLANTSLLCFEYDYDINLEIKIITKDWTESIKDIVFKYSIERETTVRGHCFRTTKVDISRPLGINLYYSLDGKEWIDAPSETIVVPAGSSIYFKGNNPSGLGGTNIRLSENNTDFISSVYLMGNVLGLLDDGLGQYDKKLPNGCFNNLFWASKGVYGATPRFLRSTKLSTSCYGSMFKDNYNFVLPPQLPATELAAYCYANMFDSCNEMITPPELPAENLQQWCYQEMFNHCIKLTSTPVLKATTLARSCYQSMFSGCTSLKQVSMIKATTLANYCCTNMFNGCSNLQVVEQSSDKQFFTCPDYDESTIKNPVLDMFANTKDVTIPTPAKTKTYSYQ